MTGNPTEQLSSSTRSALFQQVEAALRDVQDPCAVALRTDWSLIDLGLLVDVYEGPAGDLVVEMVLTDPLCPYYDRIEASVEEAVAAATGYATVTMDISGDVAWEPDRLQKEIGTAPGPRSLPLLPARFRTSEA